MQTATVKGCSKGGRSLVELVCSQQKWDFAQATLVWCFSSSAFTFKSCMFIGKVWVHLSVPVGNTTRNVLWASQPVPAAHSLPNGLLSCPVKSSVPELHPCRRGHSQSCPVKMMSFFLLSLIQQLVHKRLFVLPAPLPFSCAKPPQNLISGALQLQSNVSSRFPDCDYLRKFQIVYLSARNTCRGEFRLCCPRCILNQGENCFRYSTLHLPALSAAVNYEAAPLSCTKIKFLSSVFWRMEIFLSSVKSLSFPSVAGSRSAAQAFPFPIAPWGHGLGLSLPWH